MNIGEGNKMKELTYDEIELIKESICDGCMGMFYMHALGCYEDCEAFQEEVQNVLSEL